jgi:hypothetical protein
MSADDPFESLDAAYVLGSLSSEDRQAFETHLEGCERCSESVAAISGLPGLLSQVPDVEKPPEGLLKSALARSRRTRRRRLATVAGSAVVAVASFGALVISLMTPGPSGDPAGVSMTALGGYPVQGNVALADQNWGTSVAMSCSYGGKKAHDYVLVAIGWNGGTAELATWHAMPENTARIVVGTGMRRVDIKALEVRTTSGVPLLRLTPMPGT